MPYLFLIAVAVALTLAVLVHPFSGLGFALLFWPCAAVLHRFITGKW